MAISIRLTSDDLAETRFAFSPIWELGMSLYKPMRDPSKHALHLPWLQEAKRAIDGHDLEDPVRRGAAGRLDASMHPYTRISSRPRRRRRSHSSRTSWSRSRPPTPTASGPSWST